VRARTSLAALSPQRRRLVVAVAALCVGVCLTALVAVVASRDARPAPVAQDRPGPVLLVPGYGGSTSALQVLAERLRDAGRTAVVVTLPGDGTGDLRTSAAVVGDAAASALAAGAPSVDVVGFSAGGVTARWWVAKEGGDALARRVVTLGSPHHGTQLAGLGARLGLPGCPPACRQLAPDSDLLRTLNSGDETPTGPRWTSVWTDQDEVVTPPDSARLDGATTVVVQRVCPGTALTHGDLPRSPLVAAVVLEALDVGPGRTTYGPDDCARLSS
jgi:triacylglycerol esterase/lipase EstA (alpha/beta hydrolase family)